MTAFARILAVLALVGPPLWAYLSITADYEMQRAHVPPRHFCGTVALMFGLLACLASGLLSFAAAALRAWAVGWRTCIDRQHRVETILLVSPGLGSVGYFAYLLF